MRKYRIKKQKFDRAKKAKWSIILGTVLTLIVASIIVLVVCAYTYHWTWEQVKYWLNPFSDGNDWAWLIYVLAVALILLVIWLTHNAKMEKLFNDEHRED